MSERITAEQKVLIIGAIEATGNRTIAAQRAKVSTKTIERERKRDPKFSKDYDNARDAYADILEAILDQRIKNDKDKMGAILLMFRLKALRPDVYRDNQTIKHEGDIKIISGVPRPPTARELPPEQTLLA